MPTTKVPASRDRSSYKGLSLRTAAPDCEQVPERSPTALDALLATLAENPEDWFTRGVLADAMEEAGDPRHEAVRWQIENKKLPIYDKRSSSFDWWLYGQAEAVCGCIPKQVFERMPRENDPWMADLRTLETYYPTNYRCFVSSIAAETALWDAWVEASKGACSQELRLREVRKL